jgi:hypothetical protein
MKRKKLGKKFFPKKKTVHFLFEFIVGILVIITELMTTLKLNKKNLLILDVIICLLILLFIHLSSERRQRKVKNTSTNLLKRDIITVLIFLVFIISIKNLIILIV